MTKFLMAGVAALALMSGPAFAQKLSTETTTTTTRSVQSPTTTIQTPAANVIVTEPVAPPTSASTTVTQETTAPTTSGDFRATTKKKETTSDGRVTERTRTYTSGAEGTKSSASFRATNPDGTGVKSKDEREITRNPDGSVSTTDKSTTEVQK